MGLSIMVYRSWISFGEQAAIVAFTAKKISVPQDRQLCLIFVAAGF
jgi:hypothetical protein